MSKFLPRFEVKSLAARFKTNSALVFYLALAVIIGFECLVLYDAAKQIIASKRALDGPLPSKGVRLQLNEYRAASERISAGKKFYPGSPIFENPFNTR
ncbi:MAG: hypothetical protein HYZ51_02020 [Candidatus Doudnabacteria bacterium]|nr:hypothetical protein [Candidatus Doudnabacteria bacterium]